MQRLLLTYFGLLAFGAVNSQSLQFVDHTTGADVSGTEVVEVFSCADAYAFHYMELAHNSTKIKNLTSQPVDVKVKRYELSVPAGTVNNFAWFVGYGQMLAGNNPVWPTSFDGPFNHFRTVAPGVADSSFVAWHGPRSTCVHATYRYVAFNASDPNDSTYVDIRFEVTVGIDEKEQLTASAYPNPANDVLNIDLSKIPSNGRIEIYNLLGKEVKSQPINGITNQVDVSNLSDGLYFYNIRVDGDLRLTKKFIVKK